MIFHLLCCINFAVNNKYKIVSSDDAIIKFDKKIKYLLCLMIVFTVKNYSTENWILMQLYLQPSCYGFILSE